MSGLPDIAYKPGWRFRLGGPNNEYLCIHALTDNTLHPDQRRNTQHQRQLPPGILNDKQQFATWLLHFLQDIERHETCEWVRINGHRPFWPNHAEGDPYAQPHYWP